MQVRLEHGNRLLVLSGRPLGHGGEAVIHPVARQPGLPELVAKVYHRPTADHAAKLAAMIARPPVDPMAQHGHASITWPLDRLLPDGEPARVVGYVMPRIEKALPIAEFYNPKARLNHCPLFHFGYLLRTAHNLTAAVRAIHEGGYVIGDLNESNCLVNNQALVTVVDTDSFQVPDRGRVFRCPVGKPEYTAPELQGVRFGDVDRAVEHDNFALAVLLFQLLMQGIHPFAGKFTGTGEPAGLPERITAGHWPYAGGRVPYTANPHAPPLDVLPMPVRALMHGCFEDGHRCPERRPGSRAWQEALRDGEKELVPCSANQQHLFPGPLRRCPWCELTQRQGRDPFPSPDDVKAGRFGLRRRAGKLRKSPPVAPAPASVPAPQLVTTSLVPTSTALGPMRPPPAPRSTFAGHVLFAMVVAAISAAFSGVVLVAWTNPPWVVHLRPHPPPHPSAALVATLLGAVIGLMCGYRLGRLVHDDGGAAQTPEVYPPPTIGAVAGTLAGGLGGLWGHVVAVTDPAELAGPLGKHLGVMGLAFVGGGLGGLVGALLVGMAAGVVAALAQGTSP